MIARPKSNDRIRFFLIRFAASFSYAIYAKRHNCRFEWGTSRFT